jgi:hypothetical protein
LEEGLGSQFTDSETKGSDERMAWVNCGLSVIIQWHVPLVLYMLTKLGTQTESPAIGTLWYTSEVFWLLFFDACCVHLVWAYFRHDNPDTAIEMHLKILMIVSIIWDCTVIGFVGAANFGFFL